MQQNEHTKWTKSYRCLFSVHPCDKPSKGGCEQKCTKKGDEALCECLEPEFKIATDGKSCDPGRD